VAKRGRPSGYSSAVADKICSNMAAGISLNSTCKQTDMPSMTSVFKWLGLHKEFADKYTKAMDSRARFLFEETLEIANTPHPGERITIKEIAATRDKKAADGKTIKGKSATVEKSTVLVDMIEHRRLQVDTRKWILARMDPKKYGDRINNDVTGNVAIGITISKDDEKL